MEKDQSASIIRISQSSDGLEYIKYLQKQYEDNVKRLLYEPDASALPGHQGVARAYYEIIKLLTAARETGRN